MPFVKVMIFKWFTKMSECCTILMIAEQCVKCLNVRSFHNVFWAKYLSSFEIVAVLLNLLNNSVVISKDKISERRNNVWCLGNDNRTLVCFGVLKQFMKSCSDGNFHSKGPKIND